MSKPPSLHGLPDDKRNKKAQLLLKIFCPHSGNILARQPLMLDGSLNPTPQNPVASEIISLSWLFSKTHPSGIPLAGHRLSRLRQKSQWLCCNFGHSLCFTSQLVQRCKIAVPWTTPPFLSYEFWGNLISMCMLPDILIMMKSFPLGFHLLWASISSRFPSPGPLRMEDRICRRLNLRSKALAELRAKVAFQCHRSPLNAFIGALQDWNLHEVTTWNWRMSCSYQESQSNRRKWS